MEKRALGRGISALIPGGEPKEGILNVSIGQIKANPLQPRKIFNEQAVEDLAQSIKEKGVIQPLLVRRKGDAYELIAGERRLRAAALLNLEEVPIIIKDVDDQSSLELALVENIQREDLNPIEEARAYQYLIEKFELTQEKVGEMLGKARVSVTNILRLLKLPQEVQQEIEQGRISFAHGRVLLEVSDQNEQRRLAQEIISKSLSVRELSNLTKIRRPKKIKHRPEFSVVGQDPLAAVVEEEIRQALATKVRVNRKRKQGNIVIEFYSDDDLRRIAGIIKERSAVL